MTRPSEVTSGVIASIVGAVVALLAGYGIHVPDGVQGPLIIIIGWVAAAVTWYIARKQRAGAKASSPDGTVSKV